MKTTFLFILVTLFFIPSMKGDWITYTAPDNSFTVKFPLQPEETTMNAAFGIDRTKILQSFSFDAAKPDEAIAFTLTIQTLSEEILKPDLTEKQRFEVMENFAKTAVGLTGEITETREILLSNHPGIFVIGRITQAVNEEPYPPVYLKSCLAENKLYMLRVTCSLKNTSKDYEAFFNSFKILE